eukprot:jgi/Mesvir1/7009/Mv09141-RA.1
MACVGMLRSSPCLAPIYHHYVRLQPSSHQPAGRVRSPRAIPGSHSRYRTLEGAIAWPSVLEGPHFPNERRLRVTTGALQNRRHGAAGLDTRGSKGVSINPNIRPKHAGEGASAGAAASTPVSQRKGEDQGQSLGSSSHAHSHSHDHSHSHSHGHSHSHEHSAAHSHSHTHDHQHDHSHSHSHDHSHEHPHSHTHSHPHSHDEPHSHSHGNSHNHAHSHSHNHDHDHDHPHSHSHSRNHPLSHTHDHDHPHDHDHDHPHDHDHDHDHDHPHAHTSHDSRAAERVLWTHVGGNDGQVLLLPPSVAPRNPPLPKGAARGKVLFIDAHVAGVAGDMLAGALWDLGVPAGVFQQGLASLPITGYSVRLGQGVRSAITAARFVVRETTPQPFRDWMAIKQLLTAAPLPEGAKAIALDAFGRLAVAEASVHGVPVDDVHFHEVGAVDSIVDIVAAALAVDYLAPSQVIVSHLPMGRGLILGAAHGPLPSPPPATLSVLCGTGIPTFDAGCDGELVTPTGACLVAALATGLSRWPSMAPLRVAYGAGSRDPPDRPNLLRIVMGDPVQ